MGNHKVLKTGGEGGTTARYSMYDFIDAVYKQNIIWDRRHPNFHNRELRDKSWQQIGQELCNNFNSATTAEKQEIVKTLLKRWKNTRDSYLRINRLRLRQNGDEVARASYIYEKELRFLLDVKGETEDDEETQPKKDRCSAQRKRTVSLTPRATSKRRRQTQSSQLSSPEHHNNSSTLNDDERSDISVLPCSSSVSSTNLNTSAVAPICITTGCITDPDQAFFDSIKPHMQRMSDDRKLDFQIEVLQILRNYKPN